MGEEKNGSVIVFGSQYEKPKSIIDAISELEQYSAVLNDEEVPENFFTFKQKWEFFEVGFRDSFVSGILSALFTPIAMGVIEKLIPAFGDSSPTLFDRVFVFLLALGFSIGYALLIAGLGKYYYSNKITRTAMKNFLAGLFSGTLFKTIIAFIGFHFIYFFIFTPEKVSKVLHSLRLPENLYYRVYGWLMEFRGVFIPSAYFILFTAFLFISIPVASILYHRRKHKAEKEIEEL